MVNNRIAVLGGGNIGSAIVNGLLASKQIPAENICLTRRKKHLLVNFEEKGVLIGNDNPEAVSNSDLIVLAVQPGQFNEVLQSILPVLEKKRHMLISVVTGKGITEMKNILNIDIPLFHAMPNTAISIRESMTCITASNASEDQESMVLALFNQLGKALMITEELMSAATVLGACGIAFALRFIRATSQGGTEIGFDAEEAQLIAAQTAKGAADLLLQSGHHPEEEIDKVTTPKGCTIAGLNEMEHQGFSSALIRGITTSFKKIDLISQDQ